MFHSLQLVAQAWQPTQVSRSITRPSFSRQRPAGHQLAPPFDGAELRAPLNSAPKSDSAGVTTPVGWTSASKRGEVSPSS